LDYEPLRPQHFPVERVTMAEGSMDTPERRSFVERICALYPEVDRIEHLDVPHNRIDLDEKDPLRRQRSGKRTLVFGELGDAVRFSEEEGNTCPNYWHFSPYGYCPYGCKYCYLAGTRGVWFSPTVKIFVNLPEILAEIDRVACRLKQETAFYIGKLQDALALDPLTAYSTVLIPFFARHPYARQVLLTKSTHVERLLDLDHRGRTILSWSLNPPEVADVFEENVPTVYERISAMLRCAEGGYPVRAVIMPVIPVEGWEDAYTGFIRRLIETVPLSRLTFGGICIYRGARELMERKTSPDNVISEHMRASVRSDDGRLRYPPQLRASFYRLLIEAARDVRPDLDLALCLEEHEVWKALDLEHAVGRCNCVL
jgi:spore photoproduct lyase